MIRSATKAMEVLPCRTPFNIYVKVLAVRTMIHTPMRMETITPKFIFNKLTADPSSLNLQLKCVMLCYAMNNRTSSAAELTGIPVSAK